MRTIVGSHPEPATILALMMRKVSKLSTGAQLEQLIGRPASQLAIQLSSQPLGFVPMRRFLSFGRQVSLSASASAASGSELQCETRPEASSERPAVQRGSQEEESPLFIAGQTIGLRLSSARSSRSGSKELPSGGDCAPLSCLVLLGRLEEASASASASAEFSLDPACRRAYYMIMAELFK